MRLGESTILLPGEAAWEVSVFRSSAKDRERGFFIERPNRWGWGWENEPDMSGQIESRQPPTVAELEALLKEDGKPCTINPDGSVTW